MENKAGIDVYRGNSRKFALLILLLLVLAVPQEAFAYSSGKTGSSSTGCGGGSCHGSTNTVTPTLTTGIPSSGYTPGDVYSLTIGGTGGVSGSNGGFNLDASSGTFRQWERRFFGRLVGYCLMDHL